LGDITTNRGENGDFYGWTAPHAPSLERHWDHQVVTAQLLTGKRTIGVLLEFSNESSELTTKRGY